LSGVDGNCTHAVWGVRQFEKYSQVKSSMKFSEAFVKAVIEG
jgi:hypothetical protein